MKRILVTGGCGFIGSNYIRMKLADDDGTSIVNIDKLTYAGNPENLADLENHAGYAFRRGDIADRAFVDSVFDEFDIDAVVNFAAESHVDRSILDSTPFVRTNVLGTQVLLDASRQAGVEKFVQVSTDEVYGSLGSDGFFTEQTPLAPNSPYAASKAAADLLVRSYVKTFGFPAVITRCSNNYGPYQFPEKLLPLFISNALADEPLPVYGTGENVRDWIHVLDHCRGIDAALLRGRPGECYNFGARNELRNIDLTYRLLDLLGKPRTLIRFVEDRPGHDHRYAIDPSKAESELGWRAEIDFDAGLEQTVAWYRDHADWVERIKSGAYRHYYDTQYAQRLNNA